MRIDQLSTSVPTLSQLAVGARVNLEVDLLARYVERLRAYKEE
jgi:riboflavin synthase alpha subunit